MKVTKKTHQKTPSKANVMRTLCSKHRGLLDSIFNRPLEIEKITINGSDTAGYDKSKVECFKCHKMRHFAWECKGPRNQDSKNRNQDSSRRTINVEETSFKAMVAIDGDTEPKAVNTARPNSAVVNAVRENQVNAVKASACWVWRPTKLKVIHKNEESSILTVNIPGTDMGICPYLSDFKEFHEGYNASNDEPQPSSDAEKKDDEGVNKESGIDDQERPKNNTQDINTVGANINLLASTNVNTCSLNINTISPTVTTAPLEATHADFFV
ncbi:putative ribonuclease H-like domain-containing protein [Tanacetum coccineum]|uniref:Ribonuclease H-like domain-containing protein n=1 Tax=Tanacetum coccineum TaxID=301880 RepID=A0ABQ4Z6B9_9ASTR